MNKFFVLVAMVTMMVSYQNCSNTMNFDATEQLMAKVGEAKEDDGSNTYDGVIDEIADSMPGSPVTAPPVAAPPVAAPPVAAPPTAEPPSAPGNRYPPVAREPDHEDDDSDHDRDYDDHDQDDSDHDYADDGGASHSQASYVCVLEGRGKSVRLGQSSAGLSGDTSTVNDICMSKKACEEVVSKAFAVKGAEKRGYCGENNGREDIVKMSDAEVNEAIAKELLKRMMSSN